MLLSRNAVSDPQFQFGTRLLTLALAAPIARCWVPLTLFGAIIVIIDGLIYKRYNV